MSAIGERGEVQTCINWRGEGLAPYEIPHGGRRHRWHCFDCNEKGPAEVDGAVCRSQFVQHVKDKHPTA